MCLCEQSGAHVCVGHLLLLFTLPIARIRCKTQSLVLLQDMTARTADAVQQMSVQLSNEFSALRLVTAAVEKGIKQMQVTLEQQTAIMLQVMGSCEQIKAGQADIMQAILTTKAQADVILQTLQEKETTVMLERLSLLQRSMQYHLQDPSE